MTFSLRYFTTIAAPAVVGLVLQRLGIPLAAAICISIAIQALLLLKLGVVPTHRG